MYLKIRRENESRGDGELETGFHGQYEALMAELRLEDPEEFKNFVRVDVQMLQELYPCLR